MLASLARPSRVVSRRVMLPPRRGADNGPPALVPRVRRRCQVQASNRPKTAKPLHWKRGAGASKLGVQMTHPDLGYQQELKRTLRFKDLLIYGMIYMVPMAPMGLYGFVSSQSSGMVPLVYLVGIAAMVFTALSYSRMSREFPIAGSVYSYVQRGWNPHIGFVTGWLILIDYILVPALLYGFCGMWLHGLLPAVPTFAWTLAFIVINTAINIRGVELAARTNFILLALQLAALAIFVAVAIKVVFIDGHGAGGLSLAPIYQAHTIDLGFIATATSIAVLSFLGFDGISTLAEETEAPERTVGKATVAALILLGAIFMVQTYVAALVHPDYQNLDPDMAFFQIAREAGGPFLYYLLLIVIILAVGIANALAAQSAISRILYAMARDRLLPLSSFFRVIHPRFKTPANATLFVGLVSVAVALGLSIETITKFVNFGALTAFMLLNVTVFLYFYVRKRQRDLAGTVRYLLFPLVGLGIIAYVWSGFDRATYYVGFGWMAVGIAVGAVKSRGYREVPESLRNLSM
jgi:amino acid transporter